MFLSAAQNQLIWLKSKFRLGLPAVGLVLLAEAGCLKSARLCPVGEGAARGAGRVHGQDAAFSSGAPLSEISPATLQTAGCPASVPWVFTLVRLSFLLES